MTARDLVRMARREPLLSALLALATLLLLTEPIWLAVRVWIPVWTGVQPGLADFSFYYDGALRFLDEPLALYPDVYFGYMYPPPSVVLFFPLVLVPLPVAHALCVVGIVVLAAGCAAYAVQIWERWRGVRLPDATRLALILIALATAPVFQNLKYAQVNVLVLALALGLLELVRRDRLFAAALLLSVGFWLKLYPLALALLGWKRGREAPLVAGFAVGLVGIPLVLLPIVPLELYRQYAFDLLPYWATTTNMDALVQSLPGVLEHLRQPVTDYLRSHDAVLHPAVKTLNTIVTALLLGGLYAAVAAGRLRRDLAGVLMLAVLPVVSILGWEHTYVLALPLFLVAFLEARRRGPAAQAFVAFAVLVLMVPKLPQPQMVWTFEHWPRWLVDVFYARFLLVTLPLLGVATAWGWRASTQKTPETAASGA